MKRARLFRYARFQMSDFAFERAAVVILLAVLNMGGPVIGAREIPTSERLISATSPLGSEVMVVFSTLILLAVIFSSQELISRPRKQGYYRLIFSKPVNPVAFFAQLFVVHLVGTVLLMLLLSAAFSVVAAPLPLERIALLTAIAFVLLGGVGFLFSAFFRFDSLAVIALTGVSLLAKTVARGYTGIGPKLTGVLLPIDHLVALRPFIVGGSIHLVDVWWVLGYGMAAFVLGLIAVRYTRLAD